MTKMKKLLSVMLAAVAIVTSVLATTTDANAFWWDPQVQFMSAEDLYVTTYIHTENGGGVVHYKVYVQVENSAYNKYIHMWYCDNTKVWKESPAATYVKSLDNNRELWVIEGYVISDAQFAIHYQTDNGVDAWDNNNGNDYILSKVGQPRKY